MGKDRLKAVGLLVDQGPLHDEPRANLGEPTSPSFVDINQWRVAIRTSEKWTSLDFGDQVHAVDTIEQITQPAVCAEALMRIPVTSLSDIDL